MNGHYIRAKSPAEIADELVPFCVREGLPADTDEGRELLTRVAPLLTERMKRLTEAPPMVRFLFEDPAPDDKAKKLIEAERGWLGVVWQKLNNDRAWTAAEIEKELRWLADQSDLKPKKAFQPVRAAVTGTLVSPPLFESLEILGREETLKRLQKAASG